MSKEKPVIIVHLEGKESTLKALKTLKQSNKLTLLQIDTALFAYEFVLKALQGARGVPLADELLFWKKDSSLIECSPQADTIVDALKHDMKVDLQPLLKTKEKIVLDASQAESLLAGLTRRVSLIQGPPGMSSSLDQNSECPIHFTFDRHWKVIFGSADGVIDSRLYGPIHPRCVLHQSRPR